MGDMHLQVGSSLCISLEGSEETRANKERSIRDKNWRACMVRVLNFLVKRQEC